MSNETQFGDDPFYTKNFRARPCSTQQLEYTHVRTIMAIGLGQKLSEILLICRTCVQGLVIGAFTLNSETGGSRACVVLCLNFVQLAELLSGRCAVLAGGARAGFGAFTVGRTCDHVWINGLATSIQVCAAQDIGRL